MAGSARERPKRPLLLSLIAILVLLASAAEIVIYAGYIPSMSEAGTAAAVLIGLALNAFNLIAGAGFLFGWKWSRTLFFSVYTDRKSTRLNSSHPSLSRMPSSA